MAQKRDASMLAALPQERVSVWKEGEYRDLISTTRAFMDFLKEDVPDVCIIGLGFCDELAKNWPSEEYLPCWMWPGSYFVKDTISYQRRSMISDPDDPVPVKTYETPQGKRVRELAIDEYIDMPEDFDFGTMTTEKSPRYPDRYDVYMTEEVTRRIKPKKWTPTAPYLTKESDTIWGQPVKFGEELERCVERGVQFAVVPLYIAVNLDTDVAGHANFVVIDIGKKPVQVERFEPHGAKSHVPTHEYLDDQIQDFLRRVPQIGNDFRYFSPIQWCDLRGLQTLERDPACRASLDAMQPMGFCALWAFLYAYFRVQPQFSRMRRGQLLKQLSDEIEADPAEQCRFLAKFLEYIKRREWRKERKL